MFYGNLTGMAIEPKCRQCGIGAKLYRRAMVDTPGWKPNLDETGLWFFCDMCQIEAIKTEPEIPHNV